MLFGDIGRTWELSIDPGRVLRGPVRDVECIGKVLGGSERSFDGSGRFLEDSGWILGDLGRSWKVVGGPGWSWDVLGGSWRS